MAAHLTTGQLGLRRRSDTTKYLSIYTGAISFLGLCASLYTFIHLRGDWLGIFAFATVAAIAELGSVELHISSRSRVSVSSVVAMAAILVFGPSSGAFIHLVSGIMTAVTASYTDRKSAKSVQRVSVLQRSFFNTSMWSIAALIAGEVYVRAGGVPGSLMRWNNVLPFVLAILVDNLINLLLLIGVIQLQTGRSTKHIWQQDIQWGVPIALAAALLGGGGLALGYYMVGASSLVIFMLPVLTTSFSFRMYINNTRKYIDDLEKLTKGLELSNLELLQSLGAIVDAYDIYTYGHSTQVAVYACEIAKQMRMPKEIQEKLVRGGLIHDIGKIGVKDTIIGKTDRLTDEEYEALKRHTVIGAEIVGQMTGLQELVPLVRSHHERWDGFGYPDRLIGSEIPLESRILAVADSVDAMLSDRSYRSPRSLADVVREVKRCSGAQFDPSVVNAFLKMAEQHGEEFFVNSATRVDIALANNGIIKPAENVHYLKKSMLPTNVHYSTSELKVENIISKPKL